MENIKVHTLGRIPLGNLVGAAVALAEDACINLTWTQYPIQSTSRIEGSPRTHAILPRIQSSIALNIGPSAWKLLSTRTVEETAAALTMLPIRPPWPQVLSGSLFAKGTAFAHVSYVLACSTYVHVLGLAVSVFSTSLAGIIVT